MRDVAERVGLSRQLVSIVLRGAPGASEESRDRVLAAARELGYHPDDSARMLRRRRSGQLGVLFTMRQPFEVDLVDALYRRAAEHGYTLALGTVSEGRSANEALAALMRQRIEALIVLHSGAGPFSEAPAGIPTLLLGGPVAPAECDAVRIENALGIGLALEHLTGLGHRRIAYVGAEAGPNAEERLAGYLDAARRSGLSPEVLPSSPTEEGGHAVASELLARGGDRPTALVCVNDHCAIGALQTLVRAGVRVPQDLSIVGFDDSTAAALPFIELTSVRPDPDRMAELAVEAVRARLERPGAPAAIHRVTPVLAVRASTASPAR